MGDNTPQKPTLHLASMRQILGMKMPGVDGDGIVQYATQGDISLSEARMKAMMEKLEKEIQAQKNQETRMTAVTKEEIDGIFQNDSIDDSGEQDTNKPTDTFLFQSAGIATDFTTHNIVEQCYDAAGNPYMDLGFKGGNRGVTEDISGAAQNRELHVYFTLFANSFWRTTGFVEIHSANHYFEIYPSYDNNNRQIDFRFDGKAVKEDVNIAAPGDWNIFEIRIQTGKTDGHVTVIDNGKTIFEYIGNVLDGEPYTVVGLYDSRADYHNYVKNVAIWNGDKVPEWPVKPPADIFDKSKAVWTYHNDGHKAGMPDYVQEVVTDAKHSHTGCGIYQTSTQDDNMFGMPADTKDFWAEFDLYYDGSKIKAYDDDDTGFYLTSDVGIWLNNGTEKSYPIKADGLHHYVFHMATSDAGFVEQMWMDGTQVVDYSNSTPYSAGYFGRWSIRSDDADELLSNIDIYVMESETAHYDWHTPAISSNGTMGQDDFAVTSSFAGDSAWQAFVPFATEYINKFNENCTFDVWTKQPVQLQKVTLTSSDGYLSSKGKIYGSDNGTDWTPIGGWGDSDDHKSVDADVSADRGWHYYRFESLGRCSAHTDYNADVTYIKLLGKNV